MDTFILSKHPFPPQNPETWHMGSSTNSSSPYISKMSKSHTMPIYFVLSSLTFFSTLSTKDSCPSIHMPPHRLQYPNSSALLSFSMIYPRHQHHDCIIASSSSDCPRYNSLQSLILLIISTVRPVVKATTAFILVSHVSLAGIIIIVTIAQNYHHH